MQYIKANIETLGISLDLGWNEKREKVYTYSDNKIILIPLEEN